MFYSKDESKRMSRLCFIFFQQTNFTIFKDRKKNLQNVMCRHRRAGDIFFTIFGERSVNQSIPQKHILFIIIICFNVIFRFNIRGRQNIFLIDFIFYKFRLQILTDSTSSFMLYLETVCFLENHPEKIQMNKQFECVVVIWKRKFIRKYFGGS